MIQKTIVPQSGVGGNTVNPTPKSKKEQGPIAKRWPWTLNNYTEKDIQDIVPIFNNLGAKLYVAGREVGEEGTPHLQGYVEFETRIRPRIPVGMHRIHWGDKDGKPLRATQKTNKFAIEYCVKDGDIAFSKGLPQEIKIIKNLYPWQQEILDIFLTEPDDRTVYWFWEDTGNVGKTQFIKYMVIKYHVLFCCGGEYKDIMNLVFNQDMDECKGVFFNIPRANQGRVSYKSLESIKDGMVCNTKYETGVKIFNSPHVFCFANFPPDDTEKLSDDRWVIREL